MKRRICIATGTRAEYGLLRPVIDALRAYDQVVVSLLVTGSHLSPELGMTVDEIIHDGVAIDYRLPIISPQGGAEGITQSMANLFAGVGQAFQALKPDILVLLGDRYEAFSLASAALVHGIPLAHIDGGELSYGAIDDSFRHAITKMAWWHFTSAQEYRNRVISLGEHPSQVHFVGATAMDNLQQNLLTKAMLEKSLGLQLLAPIFLVTLHPETHYPGKALSLVQETLAAIVEANPGTILWTLANADSEGTLINEAVQSFKSKNPQLNMGVFPSLGRTRYLSAVALADVVVGNSSSGVLEAPMLGVPSVNIGERQAGRIRCASVVDCSAKKEEIIAALNRILRKEFKYSIKRMPQPFGKSGVGKRIAEILVQDPLPTTLAKRFFEAPKEN